MIFDICRIARAPAVVLAAIFMAGPAQLVSLLDTGFANSNLNSPANAVAVQSDGKIVVGGTFTMAGATTRSRLARFNADGTLDTGFADPLIDGDVAAVAAQADGKIVAADSFETLQSAGVDQKRVARFNADGTVDTGFADPATNGQVLAIAVQGDGKILFGGQFTTVASTTYHQLVRLKPEGTLDTRIPISAAWSPGWRGTAATIWP